MTTFIIVEQEHRTGVAIAAYGPINNFPAAQRKADRLNREHNNVFAVFEVQNKPWVRDDS
jgi:hypothetical protein